MKELTEYERLKLFWTIVNLDIATNALKDKKEIKKLWKVLRKIAPKLKE